MRRSYLRLIGSSVLVFWLVGFGVLFAYAKSRDWAEPQVRAQGLLWAYRTLDEAPAVRRAALVAEMADYLAVEISTVSLEETERVFGAPVRGGRQYFDRRETRAQRVYIPFRDESGVFVAGPIDPLGSTVHYPIGIVLAIFLTPLVASMVGVRLAKQLRKIERATEALASGLLSARVDNPDGPSHELAASFNAMAEKMERLVKDREELVQAVSHELGSPLSRLRFQLELLEGTHGATERRERFVAITPSSTSSTSSSPSSWVGSNRKTSP
jgi:signal transduction histidine kinase